MDRTSPPRGTPTERRIARVRAYVRDHLAGDLSLDALSEVACLSRFHWHRVYRAAIGETVWETVRRERLARAGPLLALGTLPLPELARLCGFSDANALGRAARAAWGLSPSQVRARGVAPTPEPAPRPPQEDQDMDVTLRDDPAAEIAALLHRGPYREIGHAFSLLMGRLDGVAVAGPTFAVYHDDPSAVAEADLRSHAGIEVAPGAPLPPGLDRLQLPAGRRAVTVHRGPYEGLEATWERFYAWLGASGLDVADAAPFERYLDDPREVAPEDLLTEILVPLRP